MARKIVVCSDGTGNSWSTQVSNVTRLIKFLDLSNADEQVVFYDQGIGTDPRQVDAVTSYKNENCDERRALIVLDPPVRFPVARWIAKWLGLAVGLGLRSNVKQLYKALAEAYQDGPPGTRSVIYLIGFSRGAFTVPAVAARQHERCRRRAVWTFQRRTEARQVTEAETAQSGCVLRAGLRPLVDQLWFPRRAVPTSTIAVLRPSRLRR